MDVPALTRASRVLVAGVSGAGKTTLARALGARLGLPHTELDALFHGPGWTPRETFLTEVAELVATDRWITEWQYPAARPLLAARAEVLVWLDLPTRLVMTRLTRRTLRRRLRREPLFNGNVEPPLHTVLTDPEHVVRWGWHTRHLYRELVPTALADNPGLRLVHLRSTDDAERLLAELDRT